jgi:hypothetical protein
MPTGTKTILGLAVLLVLIFIGVAAYRGQTNDTNPSVVGGNATTTDIGAGGAAGGTVPAGLTQSEQCRSMGGTWSDQYNECTGIQETSCTEIGGTWNGCASPCRNDPDAVVCIQSCVEVCTIK